MKIHNFTKSCVDWPRHDVHVEGGLVDMIDGAIEISRRTFLRKVNRIDLANLERYLGYSSHYSHGMTMSADYAVTYHRSKLHGKRVYYFKHSAIEYVFEEI